MRFLSVQVLLVADNGTLYIVHMARKNVKC